MNDEASLVNRLPVGSLVFTDGLRYDGTFGETLFHFTEVDRTLASFGASFTYSIEKFSLVSLREKRGAKENEFSLIK